MNVVEFATGIILCVNIYYLCKNTNDTVYIQPINTICNSCTNKKQSTIINDCCPEDEIIRHYCEAGCELIRYGNTGCREYKSR